MTSRIIVNGKVRFADREFYEERNAARRRSKDFAVDKDGMPVGALAVAPDDPRSPFRAGVNVTDEDEGINYRVVRHLDPKDGWATSEFWQKRWGIRHTQLIKLVAAYLVDAACEEGSRVRRYRCRDEARLLKSEVMVSISRQNAVPSRKPLPGASKSRRR